MNEVLQNILTRRSVRKFKQEQIKDEELDLILKAGVYAPSGMNKQSWQFTVVQNKEKIESLAKVVREALGRDAGYNFYAPPTLIMLSNDKENTNGLADCSCALENIFLMANSLGIGSCWINQLKTICDEKEVRELLTSFGIPENHIVWGMASIGYPDGETKAHDRKDGIIKFVK
ncbi:nitroreductase family protein [Clostridium saccharobutylicum]|uniref:Putative NADH dehydrogenase/NAD(P)H nitroreductase n=1 Tax=Clostridium saccharobutylicum DSM 13864 TaxID=1345695 RepID=U5MM58_CLOSA|nr:nitroreductase family protein [Clostridium saccharobutylicum]AGX41869.1 putative NADH dehydrogenase/NAD(P)H nitroreductase [Clostridium saccharobutylicum DSM 13864]AQR89143.1 NADPH-flavin oxidoreductase [Clostridium saccharobutylicum]AQR99044.1 NADPH-flavin oxidoreductase [Clostridium saccharobutylicum]AQS08767.1 NADPH-flavin oxidoreductase [Clostridium saccharobutylicum]AQS13032.1 NADPH-flavin oxidoreductase [Clostridium saccharobutylicum]